MTIEQAARQAAVSPSLESQVGQVVIDLAMILDTNEWQAVKRIQAATSNANHVDYYAVCFAARAATRLGMNTSDMMLIAERMYPPVCDLPRFATCHQYCPGTCGRPRRTPCA